MRVEVAPFAAEHVAGAATLLAERHGRQRETEPLLAPLEDAASLVEREWSAEGASGAVALSTGRVEAYLVGSVRENEAWGRHVWIDLGGHAAREPELARDLYAVAAEKWVAEGAELHLALVPALPELAAPWFRLACAHMHAHAIRESGAAPGPLPPGVALREGTADDLGALGPLLPLIWSHQRESPTFTGIALPDEKTFLADWKETLEESLSTSLVAELEGGIVGHVLLYPEDPDLARPPGSVYLAVGATLREVRGLGVGSRSPSARSRGRARQGTPRCTRTGAWRTWSRRASGLGEASGRRSTAWPAVSRSASSERASRSAFVALSAHGAHHGCAFPH